MATMILIQITPNNQLNYQLYLNWRSISAWSSAEAKSDCTGDGMRSMQSATLTDLSSYHTDELN